MSNPTQANRHIAISTPLGEDELLLRSFSVHEEISRLFELDLDLLSENYEIDFDQIIGKNVTVRMELPDGGTRYWNGYINRFVQGVSTSPRFAQYRATMVPWLWFLTRTSDCRIFQEKSVPDIVKEIFGDLGFSNIEDRLSGGYRTWTYCVQYRETDFNFVSRLMEQEGIYYYFKHENGKCTIVLCDSLSKHDPFGDYQEIEFTPDTRASSQRERIYEWTVEKSVRSGKFAHTDYNFEKPSTSLMSIEGDPKQHDRADYEIYDYPGEHPEKSDGDRYARLRLEELAQPHMICSGQSDSRGICPGYLFDLARHPRDDLNGEYLLVSATYQASAEDYETSGGQDPICTCNFTAIPSDVQFRPSRLTPKPIVQGSQTAVVTGPQGEEIYTDKYGQVKVQFHWDREGNKDENSSCWVRVSQVHAGKSFGGIDIPRIGEEVVVSFMEGDPDKPLITGRVYNAELMPPFGLPDKKVVSGMKSKTYKGGGYNEFTLDDSPGEEKIVVHGQYDMESTIEHDESYTIGNNRKTDVGVDDTENIGANQTITIGANQDISVGANQKLAVGGAQTQDIKGTRSIKVTAADTLQVAASRSVNVGATLSTTASAIELSCGSLTIKAAAIDITAAGAITFKAAGAIQLKAGGAIDMAAGGIVGIKAAMIKHNA